jgi:hypothetical protein
MLFGIPWITFNYREAAVKKNPAYEEIRSHLPYLSEQERSQKQKKVYGVMADHA